MYSFAMFFCSITLVPCCIHMHVLEYSYDVYLYSCFHSHLGHYCGVTTMLLVHPQFSPITAIELWPHGDIPKQCPSCPAAQFRKTTASLMCQGGLIHQPQHNY